MGWIATQETLEPWAIALAEQGLAVLAFDAGGFGESYRRAYSEEENLAAARAIAAARWVRQPLQIQWRTGFSRRSGLLLGGLVVLLMGILYQQAQAGAFSVDYVGSAAKLLGQMVLLPGLLIVGVMRSPWLQNLERRCWQV